MSLEYKMGATLLALLAVTYVVTRWNGMSAANEILGVLAVSIGFLLGRSSRT